MRDENNDLDEQFHLAHKAGDEKRLMQFHQELEDVIEVQYSTVQYIPIAKPSRNRQARTGDTVLVKSMD
jgi:hypothetical protein